MNLRDRYELSLFTISLAACPLLVFFAPLPCFYLEAIAQTTNQTQVSGIAPDSATRRVEADKLVELGVQKLDKGLHQEALQSYQSALNLYRLIKNQKGEVTALIGLGDVYESLQQFQKALEFFQQALDISKQIGDRLGESKSLIGYGSA